jgi:hypothetical protein
MKKLISFLITLVLLNSLQAQQRVSTKVEHYKGQEVVCPALFVDNPSFRDVPAHIKQRLENPNARPAGNQRASFDVTYIGFPDNAKAAFQRAIDIWAELLSSTVKIKVTAYWEDLGDNVLGAANTNDYYRNFSGSREINTFYPIALAEKLAGKDLNGINEDDIYCRFNSKIPWYYGTAPNVPLGTFDFTSIVLHELGHGLGFVSSMRVSGQQGFYGFGTRFKAIYDKFLITGENKRLVDTLQFKSPSTPLRTALVSEDIFWDGPNTSQPNKADKVYIYAPNPYEPGSSISHLDDDKYGKGGINSLMTPTASLREKNLDPGPITMAMFADMGWKSTSISHEPYKNFATLTGPLAFKTKILTDTTLKPNTARLVYVLNDGPEGQSVSVPLSYLPAEDVYVANVTFPANTSKVEYYFEVKDNFGETVTAPAMGGLKNENFVYSFEVGVKDIYGPVVEHFAPEILPTTSPVSLIANVIDDYQEGIDTVYVEYTVNGQSKNTIGLSKFRKGVDNPVFSQGSNDINAFLKENAIGGLKSGDQIKYQIIAIDKGKNKTVVPTYYAGNSQTERPTETFYEFTVTTIKNNPVSEYGADFEANADDFSMLGFSITQPENFSNKGLHSSHPHLNGLGLLDPTDGLPFMSFDRSEIAMLRVPITLKSTGATIIYDEVVLVEPGESGSNYGSSSFYDYVVVEGSFDGAFWFPLQDGYDSRAYSEMNNLYNNTLSSGTAPNSTGKGTQSLAKKREMSIYGSELSSEFAGENLLIRFRLYADQWTAGWGWSIDNLFIQREPPKILANEPIIKGLSVSPNPASEFLNIDYSVEKPQTIKVEIYNLRGQSMYTENIPVVEPQLNIKIPIGHYKSGNYILRITENGRQVAKRFVKI